MYLFSKHEPMKLRDIAALKRMSLPKVRRLLHRAERKFYREMLRLRFEHDVREYAAAAFGCDESEL